MSMLLVCILFPKHEEQWLGWLSVVRDRKVMGKGISFIERKLCLY